MKKYYKIMCGSNYMFHDNFIDGNCIGVYYELDLDLTDHLPEDWRAFNRKFIPVHLERHPGKSKIGAGLACGAVHTVCKGLLKGDIVLTPDGAGNFHIGEVIGDYEHHPESPIPHQRPVKWFTDKISKSDMSEPLNNSINSRGPVTNLSNYSDEIERMVSGIGSPSLVATDPDVEDPSAFAMEKHLEDFLVENWRRTPFGRDFDIYEEDGECIGQQFPTDSGAMDIFAVSKDHKTLMVIELKKGRANDVVVGQILRYMGYVKDELTEPDQQVKGVIIAMEDDIRLKRALSMVPNIDFYRYEVSFKLKKV
jgi:restriction system protein